LRNNLSYFSRAGGYLSGRAGNSPRNYSKSRTTGTTTQAMVRPSIQNTSLNFPSIRSNRRSIAAKRLSIPMKR